MIDIDKPSERFAIGFTDVTLRDGLQQNIGNGHEPSSVTDRSAAFDAIAAMGVQRIEIGHVGNDEGLDLAFAEHLSERADDIDDEIGIQVLLGSQTHLVARGVLALRGFDPDRVIVHVYDRVSPHLRQLASASYTARESADRIVAAAAIARNHGFTRFSISGEGAIDPAIPIEETAEFYDYTTKRLLDIGATAVNCNLANTFGFSVHEETVDELRFFNDRVKANGATVTTSVHTHNDYGDAPNYAIAALRAGFDFVEGTANGMGERYGNVALSDVAVRLLEDARTRADRQEFGHKTNPGIWRERYIDDRLVQAFGNFYASCVRISDIFDTHDRFAKTSLGNPAAYDAGSGPHAHANREFLRDPVNNPIWRNYASAALVHAILGRPDARGIVAVDDEHIKAITLATHAAGTSTHDVLSGAVDVAPPAERQKAVALAQQKIEDVLRVVQWQTGTTAT